jgi:hypothetical protein
MIVMDDRTKETLRWFFSVDMKDWTNYLAIIVAAFLFYWGIKTIIGTVTGAVAGFP